LTTTVGKNCADPEAVLIQYTHLKELYNCAYNVIEALSPAKISLFGEHC